ncbi:MAG: UDP-4-amino-4,6-dideoxy-N-acetyl-beta-L-altrosamine N-acetyltransferase [Cellvibrionaceae bacterium]
MLINHTKNAVKYSIRPVMYEDLELILSWRNHERIREVMIDKNLIEWSDHLSWYKAMEKNKLKHAFIFEWNEMPSGYISFTLLPYGKIAEWGFYIDPMLDRSKAVNKGMGTALGNAALKHAFVHLDLHKVAAKVIEHNESSVRFHRRMGFAEEGNLLDHYFFDEKYYALICFGLNKTTWLNNLNRKGCQHA